MGVAEQGEGGKDSGGETSGETGETRRKTTVTATTVARASWRKSETEELQVRQRSDRAGGNYCAEGTDRGRVQTKALSGMARI